MHIRHLIGTDNFAGVERYVATTSAELTARGHTVDVLGGDPDVMPAQIGAARFVPTVGVKALITATVAKPRPDLIHAHMTAADIAAVTTRPLVRRPVISTLHFAQPRGHDLVTRTLYGSLRLGISHEIAISAFVATRTGGHPTVIPNGVPDPNAEREAAAATERDRVVLVAQRFETEKHTTDALHAFDASGLADHGWELHLAGRGSQRPQLEALTAQLGLTDTVHFLGHIDDLATRMDTAGIFLATADAEPFGLSVVEAMAHRLPVVAANGGAHRETIATATPETCFTPHDTAAAGAILARLADSADLRHQLGEQGRSRYEEAFTISRHVDALEALYHSVVHRP